jgi:hypothetical protein
MRGLPLMRPTGAARGMCDCLNHICGSHNGQSCAESVAASNSRSCRKVSEPLALKAGAVSLGNSVVHLSSVHNRVAALAMLVLRERFALSSRVQEDHSSNRRNPLKGA